MFINRRWTHRKKEIEGRGEKYSGRGGRGGEGRSRMYKISILILFTVKGRERGRVRQI